MKHVKITYKKKEYERDIATEWSELDGEGMKLAAQLWCGGLRSDCLISEYYKIPLNVVHVLGDYLTYCLLESYPYLFPPSDDDEDEDDGEADKHKKQPKSRPTDWLAIFDAFMGDDVAFIERYKRMGALDAFRLMNRRIKQSRQPK